MEGLRGSERGSGGEVGLLAGAVGTVFIVVIQLFCAFLVWECMSVILEQIMRVS